MRIGTERGDGKRERAPNNGVAARIIGVCAGLVLLTGCIGSISNLSPAEVAGTRNVLAGRVLFFEEEQPVSCQQADFYLTLQIAGATKSVQLLPDGDCYIYVPVPPGQQYLPNVVHRSPFTGSFVFKLDPFPGVTVSENDAVTNFCTLEILFHQGAGSKTANVFIGGGRAYLKVNVRDDCALTRASLEKKLVSAGPIQDSAVLWFNRAK